MRIPILYEDRSVLAIDKPVGWLLVPFTWQRTQRNLAAALASSIAAGDFWARSRNLRFLRHVHRLDAETTGVLLLARSRGALDSLGDLFESRQMHKRYLAVVRGTPRQAAWTCADRLSPDPRQVGRMMIDPRAGKEAETAFRVLASAHGRSLIDAHPRTGRTHQIRLHLRAAGCAVEGDDLYGDAPADPAATPARRPGAFGLALRAVELAYTDPFTRRRVRIEAPAEAFLATFGFSADAARQAGAPARG